MHIVYLSLLGRAFAEGDFSLAYPIARGGGALVAGLDGIVLLGDRPTWLTIVAFVVTLGGMTLLAWGARRQQVLMAVTRAPVGYVAAIRETCVLIAALLGWKVLGEARGRIRAAGAVVVCAGLASLFLVAA